MLPVHPNRGTECSATAMLPFVRQLSSIDLSRRERLEGRKNHPIVLLHLRCRGFTPALLDLLRLGMNLADGTRRLSESHHRDALFVGMGENAGQFPGTPHRLVGHTILKFPTMGPCRAPDVIRGSETSISLIAEWRGSMRLGQGLVNGEDKTQRE